MKQWKTWMAGTAMTALLLGSTGSAMAAPVQGLPAESQTVDHQDGPHPHDGKHDGKHEGKHKLTQQQKDALKKAGIDSKAMKETRREIHDTLREIKAQSNSLHELMTKSSDTKLKTQVQTDLEPFRENMRQAHGLHMVNRNLHDEFVAAVDAADAAKIKTVFSKMETNQQQELKYVKAAQKAMQVVLKNVQNQVKS